MNKRYLKYRLHFIGWLMLLPIILIVTSFLYMYYLCRKLYKYANRQWKYIVKEL